jgi:uncharacterized protein YjeT (DUF2065 family)
VANSIFLAKLMGPVALVVGISLFMHAKSYQAMAQEFLRSPALIFLSGLLTMTAGLAVVLTHNVWVANWPVVVTLFGWLATISGAVRIVFPDQVRTMGESMLRKPTAMTIGGAIWLAVGAVLCFFGYFR